MTKWPTLPLEKRWARRWKVAGECISKATWGRQNDADARHLACLRLSGAVKSPTYTLVEPYELGEQRIYHLDLYRLADPEELEFIGGREVLSDQALCLVEWPSQGAGWLPAPDLWIRLQVASPGRLLTLSAETPHGVAALAQLETLAAEQQQECGVVQWT